MLKGRAEMEKRFNAQSVAYEAEIIQITVGYSNYKEALLEEIFNELTRNSIEYDNVTLDGENSMISFSISKDVFTTALRVLEASKKSLGFSFADFEVGLAKITILGTNAILKSIVPHEIIDCLEKEDISVKTASTSENKVSVVVVQEDMIRAANALYDEFKLNV